MHERRILGGILTLSEETHDERQLAIKAYLNRTARTEAEFSDKTTHQSPTWEDAIKIQSDVAWFGDLMSSPLKRSLVQILFFRLPGSGLRLS